MPDISFSSGPVGSLTGSTATDFYVYRWFIKETGEIFYVGKGRVERFRSFHENAHDAEKIRKLYETEIDFVEINLTEEQAIELESKEITRILDETQHRLTNRIIPFFTQRDNGYSRSSNTPELRFEKAPYLYTNEIEEHYYGMKYQSFDAVKYENLKAIVFITRNIGEETDIIYGNELERYKEEVTHLLLKKEMRILKSQYAKSVTAWIYIGDDFVTNYEMAQENALEKLGRRVPTYHLIDVWKLLKEQFGDISTFPQEEKKINPLHHRVPISEIQNLHDWEKSFDEGYPYWVEGDKERKAGNLQKAIELFDKARYHGYAMPVLYNSYAMAYRKLKDYDNEIAVIDEAIERLRSNEENSSTVAIIKLKERREKAMLLKK